MKNRLAGLPNCTTAGLCCQEHMVSRLSSGGVICIAS